MVYQNILSFQTITDSTTSSPDYQHPDHIDVARWQVYPVIMEDKSGRGATRRIGREDIIRFVNLLKKPRFPEGIDENEDLDKLLDGRRRIIEEAENESIKGEVLRHIGKDTWKIAATVGGSILIGMFLRREFYRITEKERKRRK